MKKLLPLSIVILLSFQMHAQIALDSLLTACYPFSGNANDMSGNNHNGTVHGATLTNDRFGNPNSAYYFNGVNNYIEVARFDSLVPTDEVSVSFWCRVELWQAHAQFQIQPDDASDRFNVSVQYDHSGIPATFWDYGSIYGTGRYDSLYIPFMTAWEHYVFISSASQNIMREYKNGVLQKTIAQHDVITNRIKPLWIGSGSTLACMQGEMDDIRFYNRVINDSEVMALYTMTDNCSLSAPVTDNFTTTDSAICQYDCINFNNLSSNAISYQWFFPGATPSSSTDQNPQSVCYLSPGAYGVTLIASNSGGSDSVTFSNYINVNPIPPTPVILQIGSTLYCSTDPAYSTYQWYDSATLIAGATDTSLVISHDGNYNIQITSINGCKTAAGITIVLGIQNYPTDNSVFVSPNPVTDELLINNKNLQGNSVITIYNIVGEIVYTEKTNLEHETINCKLFPAGIYFLQMKSESGSVVKRFVKE